MFSPATMQIYSAEEALRLREEVFLADEIKELRSSNAESRIKIQRSSNSPFEAGYLLGLEVARNILKMDVPLLQAGLDPEKLL